MLSSASVINANSQRRIPLQICPAAARLDRIWLIVFGDLVISQLMKRLWIAGEIVQLRIEPSGDCFIRCRFGGTPHRTGIARKSGLSHNTGAQLRSGCAAVPIHAYSPSSATGDCDANF
jgi:hypothetical protein